MKLGLRYQTTYRYEEQVGFSPHEVRLFPRSDRFGRVRRLDFTTTPKATIRYARDVFENTVASCYFPERSKELTFRLAINLDLDEKDPFHFILEPKAVEMPFEYDERTRGLLAAYRTMQVKQPLKVPGWEPPMPRKRRGTVRPLSISTSDCTNASVTNGERKAPRSLRPRRSAVGVERAGTFRYYWRRSFARWGWPPA
jgi:Transglutaminase-like enzymes, putative cysteine proteases